jgi:hypothetical protein
MKRLFVIIFIFFPVCLFSQAVKRGYIVEDVSPLGLVDISSYHGIGYIPSLDDINKAEIIIKENKATIKSSTNYYAGKRCGIFPVYNKYFRQYVGFINDKGEKFIAINYNRRKYVEGKDVSKLILYLDGGNSHWRALVNIDTMQLLDVYINGEN